MMDPVTGKPAWTQGHELPGKINETQRNFILEGATFHKGEPLPFCEMHIGYQCKASFNGLVDRGFYERYSRGFARLTHRGYRAARAILALRSDRQAPYWIAEIDAFMATHPTKDQ